MKDKYSKKSYMKKIDALIFIAELIAYFESAIGIADVNGTLGHCVYGILSHKVLRNDSHTIEYDENGKELECTLNDKDEENIRKVYSDLKDVIDVGVKKDFCRRLCELKDYIEKKVN